MADNPSWWKPLVVVTLVVVVLGGAATVLVRNDLPDRAEADPGKDSAQRFAREYVATLNTNSAERLATFSHQPPQSERVTERIAQYGGRGLTVTGLRSWNDFPRVHRVLIDARPADGQPVKLYEVLIWENGHWNIGPMVPPSSIPSPDPTATLS